MDRRHVLFRCDAGRIPEIGTGHLVRCLLLAEALRDRDIESFFCGHYDETSRRKIVDSGFDVLEALADEPEKDLLGRAVVRRQPDVLVLDHLDTNAADIAEVRDLVGVIISFDDLGTGAVLADLVINAIVGDETGPYDSYDYLVLPEPRPPERSKTEDRVVAVSFGGYDHSSVGRRIVDALDADIPAEVLWLSRTEDDGGDSDHPRVTKVIDAPDFSSLLASADVALVNGGLTMFEALANGVATIALPRYPHERRSVDRLRRRGALEAPEDEGGGEVAGAVQLLRDLLGNESRAIELRRKALETIDGQGLERVSELVTVVDRLDWDSDFFGVNIGMIYPSRLTNRLLSYALAFSEAKNIECLYYLCDCHHAESVRLAEWAGFNFVDIRLTFERPVRVGGGRLEGEVRSADENELPALQEIARNSYVDSRYYFDHQFPRSDCERFYADWLSGCVRGSLADEVFVLHDQGGKPLGYLSVKRKNAVTLSIVLLGVSEHARGQGAGKRLIDHAVEWAAQRGFTRMEVVTQGRNYAAQRAYQRAGFVTKKTELWYHLWRR